MGDDAARRKLTTVPGYEKRLVIERITDTGLYHIKFTGGGGTPTPLQGSYTTEQGAQKAIDKWLAPKPR